MNDNYLYEFFIDDVKRLLNKGDGSGSTGGGSGGSIPSVSSKAVNFYDYDGTCLYAYTVEEAQALTEMPPLPEREGLICQGWNWTLEDVKACNMAVNVGATYITDDGTTRIYITMRDGRTSPMLGVCPKGTVTVDWGDGTEPDVLTGTNVYTVKWTPNHNYAEPGDYVITLSVDGNMGFYGSNSTDTYACILRYSSSGSTRNRAYQASVKKIEIGGGVTSIGGYAFYECRSLASITIPDGVTSINNNAFGNCCSLVSITIPTGVKSIDKRAFYACHSLTSITIPDGVTSIGESMFGECCSLASITLPNSVTSIGLNAFDNCRSLASITIPNNVTSIGTGAFNNCCSLASITILNGVTSINSGAFKYCYSLESITVPNGVTSIDSYAFDSCYSLASITIPNSITSIDTSAFSNCYVLTSITIPDGVTIINANTFSKCYGIRYFDFSSHTAVPTLSATSAFTNIPSDCEIRVPAALYDEWIAATNWTSLASKIVAV